MRTGMTRKHLLKVGLLSVLISVLSIQMSDAQQEQSNEWAIRVKSEELKKQFEYKGSKLNSVAKVTIKIKKFRDNEEAQEYESLWCHEGQPIGMERTGKYTVRKGDLTQITVEQNGYTDEENKAVAFVLMRLGLAAYLHINPIISITVPERSFESIVTELRDVRHCEEFKHVGDTSYAAGVLFNLKSDTGGRAMKLIYKTAKSGG